MIKKSEMTPEAVSTSPQANTDVLAHDQEASTDESHLGTLVDRERNGLSASSLDITLERLADNNPKKYGVPLLLVAAAWAKETNTKFAILEHKKEKLANELIIAREENAAHRAKNEERAKHGPLVTVALMMGPILSTLGLNQLTSEHYGIGATLITVGIVILGSALWARRRERS